MILVTDLLDELISSLELNVQVKNVVDNGDGSFTLTVDRTWYLTDNLYFLLGSDLYKVKSFTLDSELVVTQSDHENTPIAGTYQLENPTFYHGKVKPTNDELTKIKDWYRKPPLIWLFEIFARTEPSEPDSIIDSEGELRLLFLLYCDFANWETSDHYEKVIKPMNTVVDEFLRVLRDYPLVGLLGSVTYINHANFGQYSITNPADTERNMFNITLSGIEIQPNLPLTKTC